MVKSIKQTATPDNPVPVLRQNPHVEDRKIRKPLEQSIGQEVRRLRELSGVTIAKLAKAADMSSGMLSKIENGSTSASLASLQSLAQSLNVPLSSLFKQYEQSGQATLIRAGEGLEIERRGTRAGHQYLLLGHAPHGDLIVEPYLITLKDSSDVFPVFRHEGLEFIYVLEGEVVYRHGNRKFHMKVGDSLFFDSTTPHGPEKMIALPIRFLSVISYPREA